MVVAAWELNRAMEGAPLDVDGARTVIGEGGFYRVFGSEELKGDGVTITNPGARPVNLTIGIGGHPATEEPAHANGITLKRTILTRDGRAGRAGQREAGGRVDSWSFRAGWKKASFPAASWSPICCPPGSRSRPPSSDDEGA